MLSITEMVSIEVFTSANIIEKNSNNLTASEIQHHRHPALLMQKAGHRRFSASPRKQATAGLSPVSDFSWSSTNYGSTSSFITGNKSSKGKARGFVGALLGCFAGNGEPTTMEAVQEESTVQVNDGSSFSGMFKLKNFS